MLKRILGLLGWLGVALVFAAVFAIWGPPTFLSPHSHKLAIAGLICTLLYVLSEWRAIGESFSGRQARFGTLAAASILVVVAILGAINYLGNRHNKRWDLTAAKQFSLSDQTKKVLGDLKEPVTVRVFTVSDQFPRFRDRLDEYASESKQLKVEYIDPDKKPAVAQQAGITQLNTVLFEYKGRTERATSDGEQELTNALIKVITGRTPKVYFTQGHGEKDTSSGERTGYKAISDALTADNFKVDSLVLAQVADVPADADMIVVAGPKTDFLQPEIDLLKKYLARGGKLFVMLDPVLKADQPQPALLQALLKDWGIEAGNDLVVDVSGIGQVFGGDESTPVAAIYPAHAITENFRLLTAYPLARSMSPIEGGVNGHTAQSVVQTSRDSWGETNIKGLTSGQPAKPDEGQDKKGPVSLGVAVSAPAANAPAPKEPANGDAPKTPETRVVAFGDSDFAGNGAIGVQGNRDLFLNTVNWLAQQENLISIRPRDPADRRITLTDRQAEFIRIMTIFVVPGLVLLAGVQTWWRRR